jgi:hypothetical protein
MQALAERASLARQQLNEIVEEGIKGQRQGGSLSIELRPFTSPVVGSSGSGGGGRRRGSVQQQLESLQLPSYAVQSIRSTRSQVAWERIGVQSQQAQQAQRADQEQQHTQRVRQQQQRDNNKQALLSSLSVDQDDMDAAIAHTFPVDRDSPAAPLERPASDSPQRGTRWPPRLKRKISSVLVVSGALMNSNNQ